MAQAEHRNPLDWNHLPLRVAAAGSREHLRPNTPTVWYAAHMSTRTDAAIVIAAAIACTTTIAAETEPTAPSLQASGAAQAEQLRRQLQNTRTRLNLTDAQFEQVRPILQAAFEARLEVLREYGIDLRNGSGSTGGLGFFRARRLRRDLDGVQERTMEELDDVLTDAQLEAYEELQEERREAMRERLRQRR